MFNLSTHIFSNRTSAHPHPLILKKDKQLWLCCRSSTPTASANLIACHMGRSHTCMCGVSAAFLWSLVPCSGCLFRCLRCTVYTTRYSGMHSTSCRLSFKQRWQNELLLRCGLLAQHSFRRIWTSIETEDLSTFCTPILVLVCSAQSGLDLGALIPECW